MNAQLTELQLKHVDLGKDFARLVAKGMKEAGLTGVRIKNKGLEHRVFTASIKSDQLLDVLINVKEEGFIQQDKVIYSAYGSIVMDYANSKHTKPSDSAVFNAVKAKIRQVLAKKYKYVPEFGHPWYFNDSTRYTMNNQNINLGTTCVKADTSPATSSGPRYDPQAAYFARQTPAAQARQARIAQSQFADSYGGCSSNYRY
jgi:hypothetical protein